MASDDGRQNVGTDHVATFPTVTCSGCDRDYRFDTRRHAFEFISTHRRYIGHEPELKGDPTDE